MEQRMVVVKPHLEERDKIQRKIMILYEEGDKNTGYRYYSEEKYCCWYNSQTGK